MALIDLLTSLNLINGPTQEEKLIMILTEILKTFDRAQSMKRNMDFGNSWSQRKMEGNNWNQMEFLDDRSQSGFKEEETSQFNTSRSQRQHS